LTNNLIAYNRAEEEGGGLSVQAFSPVLPSEGVFANNTIADNDQGDAGAGVWVGQHATVTLINNMVVSHTVGITNAAPASATVTADHTLFYGNGANYGSDVGSTNEIVGIEPRFVDPAARDYHLLLGSPAMNAGVTLPWLSADIDGDARPYGSAFDIGADELSGYLSVHLPLVIRSYP
jgi:hypothetical protein